MEPVRFGVISTAKIGIEKVIPAMQQSAHCRVLAIASRDLTRARAAAEALGIPRAYGSYAELLQDPEIEAIYNPLPNHLHVPISIEAAAAGKHVLCEKPIALTAAEAEKLVEARDRAGVLIQEAFMVRSHPQWLRARELVRAGGIGELRVVQGSFSYMNVDPANVRNQAGIGGGGLYDIGCYPIVTARFLFGAEPIRVASQIEYDPNFETDRLASVLLQFPDGPGAVLLLDPARTLPAHADPGHQGTDRDRDPVQRAARPPVSDLRRRRLAAGRRLGPARDLRRGQSVHACRATCSRARSARARRCRSRSRTRSPTCACSMPCSAPARAAAGRRSRVAGMPRCVRRLRLCWLTRPAGPAASPSSRQHPG